MRDSSMPSPVVDGTDAALSPELLAQRAEDVLPRGYTPTIPADARAVLELVDARDELGDVRIRHAAGALSDVDAQTVLATVSGRLARAVQLLTGGAAVVAVAAAVLVASPAPRAAAAEAPEPDPVPAVVSMVLTSGQVRASVPVTAVSATPLGYHCASVWGPTSYGRGFVGRACSRSAQFVVPVVLDSRFVPVGRSTMAVTDDVDPLGTFPQTVTLTARRPSRFGVGTWIPMPQGQVYVSAPLYAWTPSVARLTPQTYSPVQVQELVAGRWIVRATLNTGSMGIAYGTIRIGGGVHLLRVVRVAGASVWGTTGTTRRVVVTTELWDVI